MSCPECGGAAIVVSLEADRISVPVYSLEGGAAWVGPAPDFDGVEWAVDDIGCDLCGWQPDAMPSDYEIGIPIPRRPAGGVS